MCSPGGACGNVLGAVDSAVGLMTKDAITRTSYYVHALTLALVPFGNDELFFHDDGEDGDAKEAAAAAAANNSSS